MTDTEVNDFVPRSKHDLVRAEKAVQLGYPGIAPVVPLLLEWLQDMNWPVAQVLQPLLAGIGPPIAEDIRSIITGSDLIWTQWILDRVVSYSDDLITLLRPEIEALASLSGGDPEANYTAEVAQALLRLRNI